jgi:hypothetical protein
MNDRNPHKMIDSVALPPVIDRQVVMTDGFLLWYDEVIVPLGHDKNPLNPLHYYDFIAMYNDEANPDNDGNLPPKYMHDLSPDRFERNEFMSFNDLKNSTPEKPVYVTERTVSVQQRAREMFEAKL